MRVVRRILLLALLGALLLEALAWLRLPLLELLDVVYPRVGLSRDGEVIWYDVDEFVRRRLDADRNVIATWRRGDPPPRPLEWAPLFRVSRFSPRAHAFDKPRFYDESGIWDRTPLELVAWSLNQAEQDPRRAVGRMTHWRAENGRLVCRRTIDPRGPVVSSIGPDGFHRDDRAAPFGKVERVGSSLLSRPGPRSELLLESGTRLVQIALEAEAEREDVPATYTVTVRPLRPATVEDREERLYAGVVDGALLAFTGNGEVVVRHPLAPEESIRGIGGASFFGEFPRGITLVQLEPVPLSEARVTLETAAGAVHPAERHSRLYLFRPGQAPVVQEVTLVPTRASEVVVANAAAALALLRPPLLNLASAVSAPPAEPEAWWWRNPMLAGGRDLGWLLASLALAVACALRARRNARERCATGRAVSFWTAAAALLGPLGLLWMRLVLPRVPVEAVGAGRRAVNLERAPAAAEPWPAPAPLATDVFDQ